LDIQIAECDDCAIKPEGLRSDNMMATPMYLMILFMVPIEY
jgi:hypothetical protein